MLDLRRLAISYYLFGDAGAAGPNQVALAVATMIAVFIGWRCGHTLDALREAAVASVGSGIGAIFILLAVGSLIGTWAMSGTLVAMVYYGLHLLSPNYFYMTAALAVFKIPPFTAIFLGALVGGALAVFVAPDRVIAFADTGDGIPRPLLLLKGVWLALADGYSANTGYPVIDRLVTRGGMASMLSTVWLIITALAFGGVVEKAGVLERLMAPIIEAAKSVGALVASLVGAVFATNVVTADQFIAIVLPGRMFKSAFAKRGLSPLVLSRTIGASGTPTGALVPWNSCGAYMAATLGVATFHYMSYAIFNFASPLLAVAFAYLGLRMLRAPGTPGAAGAPQPASR